MTNFGWLDGLIIVAYLLTLSGIGAYFARRQTSLEGFFLAGRSMSWLPIGLSLMAALNSGIDYIGAPATIIKFGLIFAVGSLSWLFLYPWVAYVTLPFYRRLNVFSAYEYLERRFSVQVRLLAAFIFLLWRVGWMATALYVPSLAINAVSGGSLGLVPLIITLGSVVTLYTMLGGIKAVIWTDVLQFCVMFGGLATTIGFVLWNIPGGVGEVWQSGQAAGKTVFYVPIEGMADAGLLEKVRLFFSEPQAVWTILIATVVGRAAVYTGDQVMVQRFQSTRSVKDARQAFIINAVGDTVWMLGLFFVGLSLFAYYQSHALPDAIRARPDRIFPHFMANVFPTGIIGLVVAAILAASLSSMAAAISSCTSVIMVDFYNRLYRSRGGKEELSPAEQTSTSSVESRSQIRTSRIATVCVGAVGIFIAMNVSGLGIVIEIGNKVIQTFTGPLLGIYILGMFSRRARAGGVLIGGMLGTAVAIYIAFGNSGVAFQWPTVFGFVTTVVVGYLVSLAMPRNHLEQSATELTWREVMRKPAVETSDENAAPPQLKQVEPV